MALGNFARMYSDSRICFFSDKRSIPLRMCSILSWPDAFACEGYSVERGVHGRGRDGMLINVHTRMRMLKNGWGLKGVGTTWLNLKDLPPANSS